MILAVVGEKGGTGKTNTSINLATIDVTECNDTLLIDTDKQGSASSWCLLRETLGVKPRISSIQKFGAGVRTETAELSSKYENIIIDAGGRDSTELRNALLVADKAIIPIIPALFDIWTLTNMNHLVERATEANPKLKAYILINNASPNPKVKEIEEAKAEIRDFPFLRALESFLCQRAAYRHASIKGLAVTEYQPSDQKAIDEITAVYKEVFNV